MPTPDPVDTIERYAELSALMDDPFADKDEILRATGLDASTWQLVERRWMAALADAAAAEELGVRFITAYRETKARIATGDMTVPSTLPTGAQPRVLEYASAPPPSIEPEPLPSPPPLDPAAVHAVAIAETLESAGPLPVPVLPFRTAVVIREPSASTGDTLELGAVLPMPALPFTPKR